MIITFWLAYLVGQWTAERVVHPSFTRLVCHHTHIHNMGLCLCREKGQTASHSNAFQRQSDNGYPNNGSAPSVDSRGSLVNPDATARTRIEIRHPSDPHRYHSSRYSRNGANNSRSNHRQKNSSVNIDSLVLDTLALIRTLVDK